MCEVPPPSRSSCVEMCLKGHVSSQPCSTRSPVLRRECSGKRTTGGQKQQYSFASSKSSASYAKTLFNPSTPPVDQWATTRRTPNVIVSRATVSATISRAASECQTNKDIKYSDAATSVRIKLVRSLPGCMHVVVGRLLSVERRNIVGNVSADDVTDEEVRCTEALLLRVLLPAWMSDLLILGSLKPQ